MIKDISNCANDLILLRQFICTHYNTWIDNDFNLYAQTEFCNYGDLLDYISYLENLNICLNTSFYWDVIFELLCVSIIVKL